MANPGAKVAIVTGAASGIGEALSRDLISMGCNVTGIDMSGPAGHRLQEELGESFFFVQCNVTKYNELAKAFSRTFEKWKRIDAFCSNAGIADQSSVYILNHRGKKEIPPEPDLGCTNVNFGALVYGTRLSIHFMRQNPVPGGSIISTSSMTALHTAPTFPEYCGAKAAIIGFVQSAAPILKTRENITINAICPGIVLTPAVNSQMRKAFGDGLTPVSTVVAAYEQCIFDPSVNGKLIECSRDKRLYLPKPPYMDGEYSKQASKVYDPLFMFLNGEPSRLSGALDPVEESSA